MRRPRYAIPTGVGVKTYSQSHTEQQKHLPPENFLARNCDGPETQLAQVARVRCLNVQGGDQENFWTDVGHERSKV